MTGKQCLPIVGVGNASTYKDKTEEPKLFFVQQTEFCCIDFPLLTWPVHHADYDALNSKIMAV